MFLYFIIHTSRTHCSSFVSVSSLLALFIRFSPSFYQPFLLFMLLFSPLIIFYIFSFLYHSLIQLFLPFRHSFYSCFIQSSSTLLFFLPPHPPSSTLLLVSHPMPQTFLHGEFPKWIFFPSFLGHKTGGGSCRYMKHCWERPLGVPEERGSALEAS